MGRLVALLVAGLLAATAAPVTHARTRQLRGETPKDSVQWGCEIHNFNVAGVGNQLVQLINSMRLARLHGCTELTLPDCKGEAFTSSPCGGDKMWHGKGLHLAQVADLPHTFTLPRRLPEERQALDLPPGEGKPETSPHYKDGCQNEWRKERPATGWPFCFPYVHWAEAAGDVAALIPPLPLAEMLPEDELVMHLRGGDVISTLELFITGVRGKFRDMQRMQPPCAFYEGAALRGRDGNKFRRVRIVAGETPPNPCISYLHDVLPGHGVHVIGPRDKDEGAAKKDEGAADKEVVGAQLLEAFREDFGVIRRARNLAVGCSTLSMAGRLLSGPHGKRAFIPNCLFEFREAGAKGGRLGPDRPVYTWASLAASPAEVTPGQSRTITVYDFAWNASSTLREALVRGEPGDGKAGAPTKVEEAEALGAVLREVPVAGERAVAPGMYGPD